MTTHVPGRWLVSISRPRGDYTAGVDRALIESHIVTASLPPSGATVTFVPGTPREIAERVAEQARALGSGTVEVFEERVLGEDG